MSFFSACRTQHLGCFFFWNRGSRYFIMTQDQTARQDPGDNSENRPGVGNCVTALCRGSGDRRLDERKRNGSWEEHTERL